MKRDRGKPLAGKSTLNRLELTPKGAYKKSRYKKIVMHPEAIDDFLLDVFIDAQHEPPKELILDFDATDSVLHVLIFVPRARLEASLTLVNRAPPTSLSAFLTVRVPSRRPGGSVVRNAVRSTTSGQPKFRFTVTRAGPGAVS